VDALVFNEMTFQEGLDDHILYLMVCLCLPPDFVWLERKKVCRRLQTCSLLF